MRNEFFNFHAYVNESIDNELSASEKNYRESNIFHVFKGHDQKIKQLVEEYFK